MNKDHTVYLKDIIDSIDHIEKYVKDSTLKQFEEDEYMQDAVIRRFQIIGEATKRLPEEFKLNHPNIKWRHATGMRDVLIHDYNEVNFDRLWKTITEDLPLLRKQIEALIPLS